MILSHKHRYIFLHCRKTAGSSISVSLARDLGPDDLQLSGLKETHQAGIAYTRRVMREALQLHDRAGAKRIEDRLHLSGMLGSERRAERARKLIHRRYKDILGDYPYHARASAIADAFPTEWREYRKFCVVRNPWNKVISDYHWRTRDTDQPPSFEQFVKAIRDGDRLGGIVPGEPDNWPLYTIDDQIAVDAVIRFEDMQVQLNAVLSDLGVAWDGWLPRAKKRKTDASGQQKRDAVYTAELADIVGQLFQREAEAFGYSEPAKLSEQ